MLKFKNILINALNIVYPNICIACNNLITHTHNTCICEKCSKNILPNKKPHCKICAQGLPSDSYGTVEICAECRDFMRKHKVHYEQAFSALIYNDPVRKLIISWKYKHNKKAGKILKNLFLEFARESYIFNNIDIIIPIPLHFLRRTYREFNQSEELAKCVGLTYNIPMLKNGILRVKNTKPMKDLSRGMRKKNIYNAFKIKNLHIFSNKNCLIIDDILTTGTTVNEFARILNAGRPKSITVLTLARANR